MNKTNIFLGIFIISAIIGSYFYGNTQGYQTGYLSGNSDGYTKGDSLGYTRGYSVGYNKGDAYGYSIGYSIGKIDGHSIGFLLGNTEGYTRGYSVGNNDGNITGYSEGYPVGYDEGNTKGYLDGYSVGKIAGYQQGFTATGFNIRDPTYDEMVSFIVVDKTETNTYVDSSYVCHDFSYDVKRNAFNAGYRCFWVGIEYNLIYYHAVVAFNTTDRGIVYIEPQNDEIVTVEIGKMMYWFDGEYLISKIDLVP